MMMVSVTSPTWKKQQMPKPVPLKCGNRTLCQSLLSEVLLGLLFGALKWQTVAHFLRVEPKPLEMESFIFNQKIDVRPPEKPSLVLQLQWHLNSYSFWVGRKIWWAEESERTNTNIIKCSLPVKNWDKTSVISWLTALSQEQVSCSGLELDSGGKKIVQWYQPEYHEKWLCYSQRSENAEMHVLCTFDFTCAPGGANDCKGHVESSRHMIKLQSFLLLLFTACVYTIK